MLKIQFALDLAGKISRPETAPKGNRYFCPGCGEEVILRRGEVKVAHFAHKAETNCTQESILHKTAKKQIIEAISDNRNSVRIQRHCAICGSEHYQPIPTDIVSAVPERRLDSGFIADVSLIDQSKIRAAIEVHVTHFVDERKEAEIGVPFIEVEGSDIVEDPLNLKPIKDTLKTFICKDCRSDLRLYLAECHNAAALDKIELPVTFFRYALTACWKCGVQLLIFSWKNHEDPESIPASIVPPRTLKFIESKVFGSEWANICPECNKKQGNNYLYAEPDGPFFGLDLSYADEDFDTDMMKIAHAYKRNGFPLGEGK